MTLRADKHNRPLGRYMIDWRWHLSSFCVRAGIGLLQLSGWYRGYWNYWRTMFSYAEKRGLHILPCHYYSPIPDTQDLPPDFWQELRLPIGFDLKTDTALNWLSRLSRKYANEFSAFAKEPQADVHTYYLNNGAFRSGDAEILYSILRELKPRRIVEIGSGYSTLLICQAIRENKKELLGYQCECVAIEPFAPEFLRPPPAEVTRLSANL